MKSLVCDIKINPQPLFANQIIDVHDMGSIDTGPSRLERAKMLLKIIMLRGPLAFQGFLESLEVTGYKELVALLKGTQSHISEHDVKGFIKDEEKAKDLDVEVQMLKQRLGQVEKSGAQREDLVVLRHDVEDELKNVNITLQKIEELTQANRGATDTINSLRQELEKKEELLAEARRHIQALRTKVSSLETKNEQLQRTVCRLQEQIRSNEESSDKKFHEMEAEKEITDERLGKMEVNQKQMLDMVKRLDQERIGQVEKSGAQREDLVVLKHDVEDELKNVNITLQKIEELTQANREATDTINSLCQELEQKEKLLAEARRHIQALGTKVSSLKTKKKKLQGTVCRLQEQIRSNKEKSDKKFHEMEAEKKITDARLAKMEVNQNEMMKRLGPTGKKEPKGRKTYKKIVPRNRFQ
ncbi:cilia- and flagella-associated protein 58-like [Haliotis rufescens]|uniref:cilia- and flagella-associated protein 58-like n=1 Tax=Haliotis rufescens TaxID=6454 RepID=UPI00201EC670|nr:cilia- and flagella-associated protein 58-like [Haliotis rufescens]